MGCKIKGKTVLLGLSRDREEMIFIKEVGWEGRGSLMSIVSANGLVIVSGMFKLDEDALRGAIISLDAKTGNLKSNLIAK